MKVTIISEYGDVLSFLDCPEDQVAVNVPQGCSYVEGFAPGFNHRWTNGAWVGNPPPPYPYYRWDSITATWVDDRPIAEIQKTLTDAVQAHLDATAQARSYDTLVSLTSYVQSTVPKFANEARAGLDWRDNVWTYCYLQLQEALAGNRAIPTEAELIAELPPIVWPTN